MTEHADPNALLAFMQEQAATWGQSEFDSESGAHVLHGLLKHLGYRDEEIFFEYQLMGSGGLYYVDCVVGANRLARPWLVCEVYTADKSPNLANPELRFLCRAVGAEAGLLVAGVGITIIDSVAESGRRYSGFKLEDCVALIDRAGRETFAGRPFARRVRPPVSIIGPNPIFAIDHARLQNVKELAERAKAAHEKGRLYESLAEVLLSGVQCISRRARNMRTLTAEVDLVYRFDGCEIRTFFDSCDPYFLVECRNWGKAVRARDIRDFVGKLRASNCNLGLIFSRNGITGRNGEDAVGEVQKSWQHDHIAVLVVTSDMIEAVVEGADFYRALEAAYERVRFSVK